MKIAFISKTKTRKIIMHMDIFTYTEMTKDLLNKEYSQK